MVKKILNSEKTIDFIVNTLIDKKARDIVVINVSQKSSITDYFVIATGEVSKHVRALYEDLEEKLRKDLGRKLLRADGLSQDDWIVMDYADIIVHLLTPLQREWLKLEELWIGKKVS